MQSSLLSHTRRGQCLLCTTTIVVVCLSLSWGILGCKAFAQGDEKLQVQVRQELGRDVSPPLRDLIKQAPKVAAEKLELRPAEPVRKIPLPPDLKALEVEDTALQAQELKAVAPKMPSSMVHFDGLGSGVYGFTVNSIPPDTDGAVGTKQYFQVVNTSFAIFNKSTHAKTAGPSANNTIWSGFKDSNNKPSPCSKNNDGDAIVMFDALANRWVFSQFSVSTTPYLECVAVSASDDALGTYYRYAFSYSYFDDYPKMAVWPDGYYVTFNMFNGNTFMGAEVCAYDRTAMLAGKSATQQCYQQKNTVGGMLPSHFDGGTAPPSGSPNYVMTYGSNTLNLYKFHVDFAKPANSTFTGPTKITVAAFTPLCNGGNCVKQPTATKVALLDTLADRLMQPLNYRNFGDHESLVVTHSVAAKDGGGIRWYEVRNPNGTPNLYQQGTYAPDSSYRWMGSAAMDKVGNIGVGYNKSSTTVSPSIAITGRVPADSAGTLESETIAIAGSGSQTNAHDSYGFRWGDYSAMHVDPVDGCSFWYTGEYVASTGEYNWKTGIVTFGMPGCGTYCDAGQEYCSGKCVDIENDKNNCGACGKKCGTGLSCCSGKCCNLKTDNNNCGDCGNKCGLKKKCTGGSCQGEEPYCQPPNQVCYCGAQWHCAKTCTCQ